ncbi:MAG: DUF4215 domain-containing protein [Myxococcota bacterium]
MKFSTYILIAFTFFFSSCVSIKEDEETTSELCGNGIVDPGEECDDGNLINHDGCNEFCMIESFCGNGIVEPGEECDDDNQKDGDGCDHNCMVETGCGNGILELGEECDDDNIDTGDGCDGECKMENAEAVCGNSIWELGEGCDDGNTENGDGCSSNCEREDGCGDGTKSESEQCDDGNNVSGDGCSKDCQVEFICGDDNCDPDNGETCELCPEDCCPDCGNGILEEGEECDDGNNTSDDGCSRGCLDEDGEAVCGNGIWELGEECDDGNLTAHDGCSPECVREYVCGDDECTVAEGESCRNCQKDCCPACGNGVQQTGEICDTDDLNDRTCEMFGYDGGDLSCTDWCTYDFSTCTGTGPECGNDVKEYGEECDGDDMDNQDCSTLGYLGGLAFCNTDCTINKTGCTDMIRYFFEDFDELLPPNNWQFVYPWEWGTPSSVGPSNAFSGNSCVATVIEGDTPSDLDYSTNSMTTPPIDLSNADNPVLFFWAWADLTDSTYNDDAWHVEYSLDNGSSWTLITDVDPQYTSTEGSSEGWEYFEGSDSWNPYTANLASLAGETNVLLRFSAYFDHSSYTGESGIYIDDLMVVEGAHIPISITTPDDLGKAVVDTPYNTSINVWGGSGNFTYSFIGDSPSWLSLNSATGELSGTPSAADIDSYQFTIQVADADNPTNTDQKSFSLNVLDALLFVNFESGTPSGWSTSGGVWEIGSAGSSGPSSCFSGSTCVGTNFNGDYGDNLSWGDHCVTSGDIDLSAATSATLEFMGYLDSENGWDGCHVEANDGSGWTLLDQVTPPYSAGDCGSQDCWEGSAPSWQTYSVDLSSQVGQTIQVRWCFYSDSSVNDYPGFFFDDVIVVFSN